MTKEKSMKFSLRATL